MAGITSHNQVVKVDNAAGVLTAVSQRAAAEIATAINEIDVSSAGEDDMEYEPGQRSHTAIRGAAPWTTADDALFDGIAGPARQGRGGRSRTARSPVRSRSPLRAS